MTTIADPHEPRAAVLTWDYRQGPNLDQLRDLIADLSGGRLHLHHVDADSDEVVIVLTTTPLDEATALGVYLGWYATEPPPDGPFPLRHLCGSCDAGLPMTCTCPDVEFTHGPAVDDVLDPPHPDEREGATT